MIYPTRRAVLIGAAGAPLALLAGAAGEGLWSVGLAWVVALLSAMAFDALLGGARSGLSLAAPRTPLAAVARDGAAGFELRFSSRAPAAVEAALGGSERLGLFADVLRAPVERQGVDLSFPFRPERRGPARLETLWMRWTGPLGLVWKQKVFSLDLDVPVTTDLRRVREEAVRLFARDAQFGAKTQREVGEGAEFHALRDFQPGMDRRAVDWKQSARHAALLAKEFRTERNHHVILALDCGRAMSEPLGQAPRIDHAITGGLLLAYACLRSGDRAGLFSFDSAPRLSTGALGGPDAFRTLQLVAGRVDYSTEEANYTLGLTALAGELQRRSLIVIFTDFTDSTSAELMIEAVARLVERHLIIFAVMRDDELEAMIDAEPLTPEDVARAVFAGSLRRERELVTNRLRRLGVHIVEAPADRLGAATINAYLDFKRRDLL